jgi:hypothetical protein
VEPRKEEEEEEVMEFVKSFMKHVLLLNTGISVGVLMLVI